MSTPYECRHFGRTLILPCPAVELGGAATLTATTALTFDSARFLQLNASGGGFTVTLPAAPYEGCTFYLSEIVGSANAVTISGNGTLINGAASFLMNGPYRQRTLRANASGWVIIDGVN